MANPETTLSAPDLWEDAGPFLYRNLPERCAADFLPDQTCTITITKDSHGWWLSRPDLGGEYPFSTLAAAKEEGDKVIAEYDAKLPGDLLAEAGLDPAKWRVDLSDGLRFVEIDGQASISLDTRNSTTGALQWDAFRGDEAVTEHCANPADAVFAIHGVRPPAARAISTTTLIANHAYAAALARTILDAPQHCPEDGIAVINQEAIAETFAYAALIAAFSGLRTICADDEDARSRLHEMVDLMGTDAQS